MDSYTDVRGQCCGCRHVSCNTSGPSGRGSFRQTDYPDMNTFPWAVNNDYNVAVSGCNGLCSVAAVADYLRP